MKDSDAEGARAGLVQEKGFFILPSELFCNVRARATDDENLNETLERVFNNIEDSAKGSESEDDFAGLFDDLDVNSNKLGATVAKRNEKLVKLLNGVADMKLRYKDNTIDAFGSILPGGGGNNIVIGCSHVYTSDGLGMKYKLSKLQDVTIDKKHNPYLSENEAYRLGLNIKELFYKSFTELPKRVVIHKRTPFRNDEIKGLVDSLSSAGIQDVELIEITYEDDLKCFALNYNCSDADSFPVLRGLCFPLNNNTMYLYTHGISPSVKAANRKYFQGG